MSAFPPSDSADARASYPSILSSLRLQPSAEQWQVIEAIRSGCHVKVNSVAGSGKTTTACFIAALNPHCNCLLLTYNRRLKEETRLRAKEWGLDKKLEVHSFHAAGTKYFSDSCRADQGLSEVVRTAAAVRPGITLLGFDIVIIDETQDVTPLLFAFLHHLCRLIAAARGPHRPPFQLVCVGDVRQAIFGFKHADARFLRLADSCMPAHASRPWATCELSTSYRVTPPMAAFINEVMLGGAGRMVSGQPPGGVYKPVYYWTGNPWAVATALAKRIAHEINERVYNAQDVIVMGAEVVELLVCRVTFTPRHLHSHSELALQGPKSWVQDVTPADVRVDSFDVSV